MNTQLDLVPFTWAEMGYIKEYYKVTEPIAIALDLLQGEAQAYFDTLLLTIVVAKQKLQEMISSRDALALQYCTDLAKALLTSLNKRFKHFETDEKCVLAAAFFLSFATWCGCVKRNVKI
jgi:hypothetical protein